MSFLSRKRTYEILEIATDGDRPSKIVDYLLITLIVLNVIFVVIETLPSLEGRYEAFFEAFDFFSAIIFALEYGFRVWSCVEAVTRQRSLPNSRTRINYMFSPMAMIDLLSFLPSLLQVFIDADLRFLRILRLLRMFKLTRYSTSMEMVLNVVRKEKNAFFASFFVLIVLMVISASGMYHLEHAYQPEAFSSIPEAMWWAMVTLTTVGYGDVTPVTALGKILGGFIIIGGVGIVALPAGIMASAFAEEMRIRRQSLSRNIDTALEDGVIDDHEMQHLVKRASELDIEHNDMLELIQMAHQSRSEPKSNTKKCPHCGESL